MLSPSQIWAFFVQEISTSGYGGFLRRGRVSFHWVWLGLAWLGWLLVSLDDDNGTHEIKAHEERRSERAGEWFACHDRYPLPFS
jgi:hypothetical protein